MFRIPFLAYIYDFISIFSNYTLYYLDDTTFCLSSTFRHVYRPHETQTPHINCTLLLLTEALNYNLSWSIKSTTLYSRKIFSTCKSESSCIPSPFVRQLSRSLKTFQVDDCRKSHEPVGIYRDGDEGTTWWWWLGQWKFNRRYNGNGKRCV